MFEREIRDMAFVPRWAIIRTLRQQSIAEHSFFVAAYADQLCWLIEREDLAYEAVRYAMLHDLDEILSGDISSPAKAVLKTHCGTGIQVFNKWLSQQTRRRVPYYEQANPRDLDVKPVVIVADLLEAVLFLADEEFMGNRNVVDVRRALEKSLERAIHDLPCTEELKKKVREHIGASINSALSRCSAVVYGNEEIQ